MKSNNLVCENSSTVGQIVINQILEYVKTAKGENIQNICDKTGLNRELIRSLREAKVKRPSSEAIEAFKRSYPEFSLWWLLTGEGDMLETETKKTPQKQEKAPSIVNNSSNIGNQAVNNNMEAVAALKADNDYLRHQLDKALATILNLSNR